MKTWPLLEGAAHLLMPMVMPGPGFDGEKLHESIHRHSSAVVADRLRAEGRLSSSELLSCHETLNWPETLGVARLLGLSPRDLDASRSSLDSYLALFEKTPPADAEAKFLAAAGALRASIEKVLEQGRPAFSAFSSGEAAKRWPSSSSRSGRMPKA